MSTGLPATSITLAHLRPEAKSAFSGPQPGPRPRLCPSVPPHQRQQRDLGRAGEADRGVAVGAAACGDVEVGALVARRVGGQALDPVGVQVAVGDQGSVEGDAQLAAVRVAGQDQGVAVGREGVQGAQVRGVDHADGEVGAGFRAALDLGVAVALDVRVVQARERDLRALQLEPAPGVRQVQPARLVEGVAHRLPRVVHDADRGLVAVEAVLALDLLQEVAAWVAQLGPVVVVGAEDVHPRELHQRPERVQHLGHRLRVGEVVARVHHEVRAQARQRLEPGALLALAAHHVDVGHLEDAQRTCAVREYGNGDPPQAERAGLESGGVGEAGGADRRTDCRDFQGYSVACAHLSIVADTVPGAENRRAAGAPHLSQSRHDHAQVQAQGRPPHGHEGA